MSRPRLDPETQDAPVLSAAVTGAVNQRVLELATEVGSKSQAVRKLISLGLAALDAEGRAPPGNGR
jgi:type III secretion system FlhB-like substrate exporter